MTVMPAPTFPAFRIRDDDVGHRAGLETLSLEDLGPGDVVIDARYSSINYKDALAGTGRGKILRASPLVGGIDVAGVVCDSRDARFREGDEVLVTGCGLGESHDGGYARRVRVPGNWVVPLPDGVTLYSAMALGTAGFSAALALKRLEDNHQRPDLGPMVVTGASGGVGSWAVALLSAAGYEVTALSGKSSRRDYLLALGANTVLDRKSLDPGDRPLEKARWGGAVDNLGGEILSWLVRSVRPWGNIACVGLAADPELRGTVMPLILRGVSLVGISSSNCPLPWRLPIWERLAGLVRAEHVHAIVSAEVELADLPARFEAMLDGRTWGRTVVRL